MPTVPRAPTDVADLRRQVAALHWYHSIDLGGGLVTPGTPVNRAMLEQGLPPMSGRTVLDIGAWDGLYSFVAEQRGASRVVALDHYAWLVDFDARNEYWARCEAEGRLPDPDRDLSDFARPDTLPGRRGFELAHQVLDSAVEPVVGDFLTMDPAELGQFDVVLFLGVLYHLRDPMAALRHVRALTTGVAVIETEAIEVVGMAGAALLSFTEGAELRADHSNWFVPTRGALAGMCRAAGFSDVEVRIGPPGRSSLVRGAVGRAARELVRRGGARHARASSPATERVLLQRYRIAVHAYP
jgi:tRNA (mo5U34)-methyltransferase